MSNKIKKVLGRNVYIQMPPKPDGKVIVDENTKEALHQAMLKELRVTTIYAKGDLVSKDINIGDKVLVNPAALANPRTPMLSLGEKGEEIIVALIQDYEIVHIWE